MAETAGKGARHWSPPAGLSWQWQLTGPIDRSVAAEVFDVDGFETSSAEVAALHRQGAKVVCYLDMGAVEPGRPDSGSFPDVVVGNPVQGWDEEHYLDIRRLDLLGPIFEARLDLCRNKGFDGVEADLVDAYDNDSGFAITRADELTFIRWLIAECHARGLAFGLKNVPDLVPDLADDIDFAIAEECIEQGWCGSYDVLTAKGKAVFDAEYTEVSPRACARAAAAGISVIRKHLELDAWRRRCA
ncbi:MAG TPA: endo alpha-1,4 polygalactosaminidase [Acidimicrobiales bacterium]|nr:endo alpha-1,4 polygalactosaminidase [Acidimicrobiales bacterium]